MDLGTAAAPCPADDGPLVLVAGDTHGNHEWIGVLASIARHHGCRRILQLGDFGYWPHWHDHLEFRTEVDRHLTEADAHLWWIDGNHENHEALIELARSFGAGGAIPTTKRTHWLPRGTRWTWGGVRFGALGGASSIDPHLRVEGSTWWPGEVPVEADLEALGPADLDVLVCHDAPAGVTLDAPLGAPPPSSVIERCEDVRSLLLRAVERTRPRLVLHGHWHQRHTSSLAMPAGSVVVEGLADDGCADGRSWALLRLDSLRLVSPPDRVS